MTETLYDYFSRNAGKGKKKTLEEYQSIVDNYQSTGELPRKEQSSFMEAYKQLYNEMNPPAQAPAPYVPISNQHPEFPNMFKTVQKVSSMPFPTDPVELNRMARDKQDPSNPILKGIKDYSIDMLAEGIDRWRYGTQAGKIADVFGQAAGHAIGGPVTAPVATTGNPTLDKAVQFAGASVGLLVNPGQPTGTLGVSQFFENPILNNLGTRAGNFVQSKLPDAGLALSRDGSAIVNSLAGSSVNAATRGAVQGALGGAAYAPFNVLGTGGEIRDIPMGVLEQGLMGGALGGVFGGAAGGIGGALGKRRSIPGAFNAEAEAANTGRYTRAAEDNGYAGLLPNSNHAEAFDFINQRTGSYGRQLELMEPIAQRRYNEAIQRRQQASSGKDAIAANGKVQTFTLPDGSPYSLNIYDASTAIKQIDTDIARLDNLYAQSIKEQYDFLKKSLRDRAGVRQGELIRDREGTVMGRTGRISENPMWYRDFYAENKRVPSNKDLYILAKRHVDDGYRDESGNIPSWAVENNYHETKASLEQVRRELSNSITDPNPAISFKKEVIAKNPVGPSRTIVNPQKTEKARIIPKSNEPMYPELRPGLPSITDFIKRINETEANPDVKALRVKGVETNSSAKTKTVPQAKVSDAQAYEGNTIPFREAASQTERTISRNQVVKNFRKNLGIVIDTGKMKKYRGALGIYKITPEVVRSRQAEDLQVISHEIGHHLDKKFAFQDGRFKKEMGQILKSNDTLDLAAYSREELHAEGIAEYVRLRLTDPELARKLAPEFSRYFDGKLTPQMLKGLEASARDVDTWITQGAYNQAKGLIDFESGTRKEKFSKSKAYARFFDDLHPIKLAEKALKGSIGIGKESAYKMARLSRGIAERAKMGVTRGLFDDAGNKVSEGLRQIVEPLEAVGVKERDFATYLVVKHAEDLSQLGRATPFDKTQISAVLKKLESIPEVIEAQKKIIAYNNALVDMLVEAQIVSQKAVDTMRKKYPNYVPFMRYFDADAEAGFKNGGFGAAKGFANLTNPVKRMSEEGSTRTIINPIESMVKNTFLIMNAAAKNKVGLQLAELSKIDGAGAWIEHVGEGGREAKSHIITVFQEGKQQQYQIREPELYNAMLSLDHESSNAIIRFAGGFSGVLRTGATLTPEFMIRNAFRDVVGATVNSTQYGFNPLDFFKGLAHVVGKSDTYEKFINSGGAMGTQMSLDRDASREALKAVFKLSMKDKAMNIITSPSELAKLLTLYTPMKKVIGGLRAAAEVSELSTKVGAFAKTLNKTGSLEEAAYTAKDLMDFNRSGSSIRQANRMIAFLNASLQGTDRTIRAFNDSPTKFMVRAFSSLVLPSIGLYYWVRSLPKEQQDIYNNIPQWQKDSFFIIPGPNNEFFRIPKPFEVGMLFSTGTERFLRWLENDDPEVFKKYGYGLTQTLSPPVMFSALTPLIEATTNFSFFRDGAVVPQGEQRFEKKDQYGLYTSETAKLLGEGISKVPGLGDSNAASPRIIDNTIKGYTAGLGQYAVAGLDGVIKSLGGGDNIPRPAKKPSESILARPFMATTAGGGQIREDFYNKWDELSKKKASADRKEQEFRDPQYIQLKPAKSAIDKLMKQYKLIQQAKDIAPESKRAQLDELDKEMNSIAKNALGRK
ncbi:LPD38 domain-containing protein [Paenibacillus chitinolyticus]|uniref:LPD38 domain-containing protein n=1 Tax=Paenibacillus chitinolyticus TaxID=79263 RepID=UPI00364CCBA4